MSNFLKDTPKESIVSQEGKLIAVPNSLIGVFVRPDKKVNVLLEVTSEIKNPTGLFTKNDQLNLMNLLSHIMEEKYEDL